ncbi:hypothetical protein S83_027205 [Arachis hypogaea]|nr:uncharacterized protein DS421_8g252420 [Arachis hypogaea]
MDLATDCSACLKAFPLKLLLFSIPVPARYPHPFHSSAPTSVETIFSVALAMILYMTSMGCSVSSLITDSKVRSGTIVFTFSANPFWKTVDHPVFPYDFLGIRNGIFVSGTLNWIVYDPTIDYFELEWFVLTFDLETELFG